jgi:hypothetical protein
LIAADTPPPAVAAPAPEPLVVSRRDGTEVVASRDVALVLTKRARREDALLRQAVFITASLTVVRQPASAAAAGDRYRWSYKAFLQRQVCATSMTGLFACTEPEVEKLPEGAEGEAPVETAEAYPLAEAARVDLTSTLKARAVMLFETDRRTHIGPLFRAAGVTAASAPSSATSAKR